MNKREQKKLNEQLLGAAREGNLKKVKELLDAGAEIEAKDDSGWTAFHWASARSDLEIVKELIEMGANKLVK